MGFIIFRKKLKVKCVIDVKKDISVCRLIIRLAALIVTARVCPQFVMKLLDIDYIRYVIPSLFYIEILYYLLVS